MAKFPYTAAVTAKVTDQGTGVTTFTFTVKNGNALLLDTVTFALPAGSSPEEFMRVVLHAVATSASADIALADIPVGASFSFQPQDLVS